MRESVSKDNSKQRGQMAIFVALIFQVLFLFFAMAINIGLVVSDKINLQNATDLAAYYAAQRQAEMLNVIAHTNYQIRQAYKLLAWRYYVLGMLGQETGDVHPARNPYSSKSDKTPWGPVTNHVPTICIDDKTIWTSAGSGDNPCKLKTINIPNVVIPPVIAGFNPVNAFFAITSGILQNKIAQTCNAYAGDNLMFSLLIYSSFWRDQKDRKQLIYALAQNLMKSGDGFLDLNGDSVRAGAAKTFEKNLTMTNLGGNVGAGKYSFEMFNSLSADATGGKKPQDLFAPQDVWFTLLYRDIIGQGKNCTSEGKFIGNTNLASSQNSSAIAKIKQKFAAQSSLINDMLQYSAVAAGATPGDPNRLSMGVEKNPWYLAYICIKAKTTPRQLFFPFGKPSEFTATACAQPFGGRIGPWFGKSWSRGAATSEGDTLQLSPKKMGGNAPGQGSADEMVPIYSKYPSDEFGLKSSLAQQSLVNLRNLKANIANYFGVINIGQGQANDPVAYDPPPKAHNIRDFEIAALAPDLFDITYYSIQPNFDERYLQKLRKLRDKLSANNTGDPVPYPRGDLGSDDRGGGSSVDGHNNFSVRAQILLANGVNPATSTGTPTQFQDRNYVFWYVQKPEHLLTSWVHNDTYGEYTDFPDKRFGNCVESDLQLKIPNAPGGCLDSGGRAGYSVKLVSPEMFTKELPLGGANTTGTILNPPPQDF